MTLPIQWRVLPGPHDRIKIISAVMPYRNVQVEKTMVVPLNYTKRMLWLCVAAMKAEIENTVSGADALLPGGRIHGVAGGEA
jgi:hypothetical protein